MNRRMLNGWDEISAYLQRSVRTAQRWEKQFDLPVYRPAVKERAAVIAFANELDAWLRGDPRSQGDEDGMAEVFARVSSLVADAAELASRVCMLKEQVRQLLPAEHPRSSLRPRRARREPGSVLHFPQPASGAGAAR